MFPTVSDARAGSWLPYQCVRGACSKSHDSTLPFPRIVEHVKCCHQTVMMKSQISMQGSAKVKTGVHFLVWNKKFFLEKDQNNVPGRPDASCRWSSTSLAVSVIYFFNGKTNPVFLTVKTFIRKKRNIFLKLYQINPALGSIEMKTECCRGVGFFLSQTKAAVKCLQLIVLKLSGFMGWTPLVSPLLAWMWLHMIQWAIYASFFIRHPALEFSDFGRDGWKRSCLLSPLLSRTILLWSRRPRRLLPPPHPRLCSTLHTSSSHSELYHLRVGRPNPRHVIYPI